MVQARSAFISGLFRCRMPLLIFIIRVVASEGVVDIVCPSRKLRLNV